MKFVSIWFITMDAAHKHVHRMSWAGHVVGIARDEPHGFWLMLTLPNSELERYRREYPTPKPVILGDY